MLPNIPLQQLALPVLNFAEASHQGGSGEGGGADFLFPMFGCALVEKPSEVCVCVCVCPCGRGEVWVGGWDGEGVGAANM